MELPFRSKTELSGGTIKWDYHLEAVTEVSGETIKWIYHFEVRLRYEMGLSSGITF